MRSFVPLCLLCILSMSAGQNLQRETCSAARSEVDVDVASAGALIGGIFQLRSSLLGGYACGTPHKELIQVYEAARWALQRVNSNNVVPGIRLGMKAFDDCGSSFMSIRAAQKFYQQFSSTQLACTESSKLNLGILGPLSSWTTEPVAEMMSSIPASIISPRAVHPALSNKAKYPYFLRTGRNWSSQVKAMIYLLNQMNWKRIVLVYSTSAHGSSGFEEFRAQAFTRGVCIIKAIGVPSMGSSSDFRSKLSNIANYGVQTAVFLGSGVETATLLGSTDQYVSAMQWLVADIFRMDGSTPLSQRSSNAKGVIVVMPKVKEVTEFRDYFVQLSENSPPSQNPWFSDWYMTVYNCRLPGVNYAPFVSLGSCTQTINKRTIYQQVPYVETTIQAVYAYAKALRSAQRSRCGNGYVGTCDALRSMTTTEFHNILKTIDFTFGSTDGIPSLVGTRVQFDLNGDNANQDFTIFNYNDLTSNSNFVFEEVGSYVNGILSLDMSKVRMYHTSRSFPLTAPPTSFCPLQGCNYCVTPKNMLDFYYTPGDINIGVGLSAHDAGLDRFTCGHDIVYGMQQALGVQYAIENYNVAMPGILNGVKLGSVIVDMCKNANSGAIFFNNLLAGREITRDRNGRVVDPYSVKAIIEAMDNQETMIFSPHIQAFGLPEVGTSSSSATFINDKIKYPYYSRTVTGSYRQAAAIVNFMLQKGWYYIQAVYSESMVEDANHLKSLSLIPKICVSAEHKMENGKAAEVLAKVRSNPNAKVVVMFLEREHIRDILNTIRGASWTRDFVIIGGESWGTDNLNIAGLESFAAGVITFQPQKYPTTAFRTWLNLKQAQSDYSTPWFRELYEHAFQCYLDASSRGSNSNGLYSRPCGSLGMANSPLYDESYVLSSSMNAVFTIAKALDETLKHFCGNTYSGVCIKYRTANDSNSVLLENIRKAKFVVASSAFEMSNGQALTGVEVFQYRLNQRFVPIAFYNTQSGSLTISDTSLTLPGGISAANFRSLCPAVCAECAYLTKSGYSYVPGDITIGAVFGVHAVSAIYPTLCGDMNIANGVQFGLAMHYAIEQINKKLAPVSLNGISVGGLILDHCNIPTVSQDVISYVYTEQGLLSAQDRMKLDTSKIVGWITDSTSAVNDVAGITNKLDIPLISPIASSAALQEYPTYFRTIQGDVAISVAISKLAKSLSYNYVHVIYSPGTFGEGAMETFSAVAAQEGLCVLQKYKISATQNASQILSLIQSSTSQAIVLWTGGEDTAKILAAKKAKQSVYENMVMISSMPFMSLVKQYGLAAKGTFMLNIKTSEVTGYKQFIDSLTADVYMSNIFMYEYYMVMFECNLPGFNFYPRSCPYPYSPITSSSKYSQDNYVVPTINAVYALIGAMDAVLKDKCGPDYKGVCSAFTATENINKIIMQKMESISFTDPLGNNFEFIEREGNMGMEVNYYDGSVLKTVGDFAGASLRLQEASFVLPTVSSVCLAPCLACIQKNLDFTYIPGDILLGGLFDVHENSLVPFSCGNLKTRGGFQLLEAFNYALGKVNDKSDQSPFRNVLRNIKLGGIGLDACQSSIRTGYLVSDIHNGVIKLTRNGQTVNPDDISLYIGGRSSDSSLYLARILKTLKIPQISYASSSDTLSDQDRYPYFIRTVPSDDKQSLAMIKFLDASNIRYVQIVHTPSDYGKNGAKKFNSLATLNKICVAQSIEFPDNFTVTRESADKVIKALLDKPVANTVIVFADETYINAMLKAITRNAGAVGKFRFIGSETWGTSFDAIAGVEYLAKGSVTLNLEKSDIQDFDTHIGQKSPGNYPENPWFSEFYEEMVNCYLTVPTSRHKTQCLSQTMNIAAQRDYIQDPGILHVINAVYAAAYGLDSALTALCGANYTTVCEQFKNNQNIHNRLVSSVLQSTFVDPSGATFSFRQQRRDGNKGYFLYDIEERMTMNQLGYTYQKIGTFSSSDVLSMDSSYKADWDGSCEREGSCSECPTIRNLLQRYMLQPAKSPNAATLLALYPVHHQGTDAYRCGSLRMSTFYIAMAFFYTLERYFPNSKYDLRGLVVDTCSNNLRMDQDIFSLFSSGRLCNSEFTFDTTINNYTLAGFQTTWSSMVVAANRVLRPLRVPIVSSTATSAALSDKSKYPYFVRTTPPDNLQMEVIVNILKENDWHSASVIYSQDSYGISAFQDLQRLSRSKNTCFGYSSPVPSSATSEAAKDVVRGVESNALSNVIILVAVNPRQILQAAKELNLLHKFIWIGSEAWGTDTSVVAGLENDLLGAITVDLRSAIVDEFSKYIGELKYNSANRKNIPNDWFEEFYQTYHKCNIPSAKVNFPNYPSCTLSETINYQDVTNQPYVLNTIAATYAYGKAIESVGTGLCSLKPTFRECFSDPAAWADLLRKIQTVEWEMKDSLTLIPSESFKVVFTNGSYWNVGYNINYYMKDGNRHGFRKIGTMIDRDFSFGKIAPYNSYRDGSWSSCRPERVCTCSAPVTSALTGNETVVRTKAAEPRNYYFYNVQNMTINGIWTEVYDRTYTWPIWAIAVAVPTCVGLFITIFLFFYFLIFYPVRGGTTILGFMMMVGIMGIYTINFAFFLPASAATCGGRQFVLGVVYAIVFAALLVKSVDNWRFNDVEYTVRKYKGITSACALFLVALGIVCLQLIIPIEWLILQPPSASLMADATNLHDWMMCDPHDMYDKALVMSMIFVMFLVLLTAIFAGMAWDSESNYYESRWIVVSCVCTAGCFMVWMIVITNASPPNRDAAVALGNMFNATLILIFMTIRKLVLMVWLQNAELEDKQASIIDERGNDLYSTVYSNPGYDTDDAVFQPSSPKHSDIDNGDAHF